MGFEAAECQYDISMVVLILTESWICTPVLMIVCGAIFSGDHSWRLCPCTTGSIADAAPADSLHERLSKTLVSQVAAKI